MQKRSNTANNLWVFREGRNNVASEPFRRQLAQSVSLLKDSPGKRNAINALIMAGEFEAAIGDVDALQLTPAARLTDILARCLWPDDTTALSLLDDALAKICTMQLPDCLRISPPEGFAYYALHPLDFAQLAEDVAQGCTSAAVIGIRSIGTTLSAIVLAALLRQGRPAQRITVRPTGHPYDRTTRLTAEQQAWAELQRQSGSQFLVVDEGPGRSGSSFLSVAEALEQAGVPATAITLLGSRPVNSNDLCAPNGAQRWSRFRFLWPHPRVYGRFNNDVYVGGGEWRKALLRTEANCWPACWPQMERFKFLSADRRAIYKFEGFGSFGETSLARAQQVAQANFGPPPAYADDGMIEYPVITGEILHSTSASPAVLSRIADYCAFRAKQFQVVKAPPTQVGEMLRFNVQQEFGVELDLDVSVFSTTHPVLVDGRMQPYEWISNPHRTLLKVDACSHGDDHFFPGPTDIAWDLAGAVVEWGLEADATEFLLSRYYRLTGENPASRFPAYLLAYAVFRMGYCLMALSTVTGTADYERLQRAAEHYRRVAQRCLQERPNPGKNRRFSLPHQPVPLCGGQPPAEPAA